MIQNIHPNQFDNTFIADCECSSDSYIFSFHEGSLCLKSNSSKLELPTTTDFKTFTENPIFLFTLNNKTCFWAENAALKTTIGFVEHEVRFGNTLQEKELDWSCSVAIQIRNWYNSHLYCGKCGAKTAMKNNERALMCTQCGHTVFPSISPAIIVAILCGDKLLLARGSAFRDGFFSLVAGYVDIGETIEQTVQREIREEVGISVSEIRYYKSQPWPFSGSMMLGFIAKTDKEQDIVIDNNEIAEAGWYTKDKLPEFPAERSIAGEMINLFKQGKLAF